MDDLYDRSETCAPRNGGIGVIQSIGSSVYTNLIWKHVPTAHLGIEEA